MALVTFHVSVVSPRTTALDNIDRDHCHHTATSSGLQKDTFLSLPSDALHLNIQESLLSLEKVSQRSDVKNAFLELNCLSFNPGFTICRLFILKRACLVVQTVKNPPALQETWVGSLGWEHPLEKGMATHSSILAWRIPLTEEPGRLQSMGSQRVGHD